MYIKNDNTPLEHRLCGDTTRATPCYYALLHSAQIIANPGSPTGIDLREETSATVSGIAGAGTGEAVKRVRRRCLSSHGICNSIEQLQKIKECH